MLGDFPSTPNMRLVRLPMKFPCSRKSTSAPSAAKILETGSPHHRWESTRKGWHEAMGLNATFFFNHETTILDINSCGT